MAREIPSFASDAEAAAFLDQDLSDLDFAKFKPVSFAFSSKPAQLKMRIPHALLEAIKRQAHARGIPYTRYVRELIERAVAPEAETHP